MIGYIVKRILNDNEISYLGNQGFVSNKEDARVFKTLRGARYARYQEEHYWDDPFALFGTQKPDNEIFVVEEI